MQHWGLFLGVLAVWVLSGILVRRLTEQANVAPFPFLALAVMVGPGAVWAARELLKLPPRTCRTALLLVLPLCTGLAGLVAFTLLLSRGAFFFYDLSIELPPATDAMVAWMSFTHHPLGSALCLILWLVLPRFLVWLCLRALHVWPRRAATRPGAWMWALPSGLMLPGVVGGGLLLTVLMLFLYPALIQPLSGFSGCMDGCVPPWSFPTTRPWLFPDWVLLGALWGLGPPVAARMAWGRGHSPTLFAALALLLGPAALGATWLLTRERRPPAYLRLAREEGLPDSYLESTRRLEAWRLHLRLLVAIPTGFTLLWAWLAALYSPVLRADLESLDESIPVSARVLPHPFADTPVLLWMLALAAPALIALAIRLLPAVREGLHRVAQAWKAEVARYVADPHGQAALLPPDAATVSASEGALEALERCRPGHVATANLFMLACFLAATVTLALRLAHTT